MAIYGMPDLERVDSFPGDRKLIPLGEKRSFTKISVGNPGNIWTLDEKGAVFHWMGHEFEKVGIASLADIAVGRDGTVWGLTKDSMDLVKWGRNQWELVLAKEQVSTRYQPHWPDRLICSHRLSLWGLKEDDTNLPPFRWIRGIENKWKSFRKQLGPGTKFDSLSSIRLENGQGYLLGYERENRQIWMTSTNQYRDFGWQEVQYLTKDLDLGPWEDVVIVNPHTTNANELVIWALEEERILGMLLNTETKCLSDFQTIYSFEKELQFHQLVVSEDGMAYLAGEDQIFRLGMNDQEAWFRTGKVAFQQITVENQSIVWALNTGESTNELPISVGQKQLDDVLQREIYQWKQPHMVQKIALKQLVSQYLATFFFQRHRNLPNLKGISWGISEENVVYELGLIGEEIHVNQVSNINAPTTVQYIDVGIDNLGSPMLWCLTKDDQVYLYHYNQEEKHENSWQQQTYIQLKGGEKIIAGNFGRLCVLDQKHVHLYMEKKPLKMLRRPDRKKYQLVYLDHSLKCLDSSGQLIEWDIVGKEVKVRCMDWRLPGSAIQVSIAGDGTAWALDQTGQAFHRSEYPVVKNSLSVFAIFREEQVEEGDGGKYGENPHGVSRLVLRKLSDRLRSSWNYGATLRKEDQWIDMYSGAFGTGFLINSTTILTAAHIIKNDFYHSVQDVSRLRFVFGFQSYRKDKQQFVMNNYDIFRGVQDPPPDYELSAKPRPPKTKDWAIIKLDRPVRRPVVKPKFLDALPRYKEVYMIGHPVGLPTIWTPGGTIPTKSANDGFIFESNLDGMMGNSGSPVFDRFSHEVIGIFYRGQDDFQKVGDTFQLILYTPDYPELERTQEISRVPLKYFLSNSEKSCLSNS